jgi:hypothetical protein
MIQFFRKIRRRLLTENRPAVTQQRAGKVSKYLLYALGEIALVMIGILLALQVNNWNESQKDFRQEQILIKQLTEEYESSIIQLENKISQRDRLMLQSKELLELAASQTQITSDSLSKKFATFLQDPTFDPIENDLFSSGKIRLIKNDSLKVLLSHWSSDLKSYKETETLQHDHMVSDIIPFMKRVGTMQNSTYEFWERAELQTGLFEQGKNVSISNAGKSMTSLNVQEVLQDQELPGLFSYIFHISKINNVEAYSLKKKIEQILDLLDKESKKG